MFNYYMCMSKSNTPTIEGFRTSTKYQEDRSAAAGIFGVAAFANGIIEDRIGCALEDDYFFRDTTLPGELPTSGNHGDRTSRQRVEVISPSLCSRLYRASFSSSTDRTSND
jgi:hypothetical protein